MSNSIRWAFNVKEWKPTKEQWKLCLQCVQKEEAERCNRFHFVSDCKASMIGRLLMRKAINESLVIDYDKIRLDRTSVGKPFLISPSKKYLSFNVSHSGDFCVLASELDFPVGVDVMKVEYKGKKSLSEYFNIMKKQFSDLEWNFITHPGLEKEQLQRFFRLWCLKESYVKATGQGIAYDLQKLSFCCKTFELKEREITSDTYLFKDKIHQKDWTFEETFINANHCVAVAINYSLEENQCKKQVSSKQFTLLDYKELMRNCVPFENEVEIFWDIYTSKSEKTF